MYFLAMEMGGDKFTEFIKQNGYGRMVITKTITPYPGEKWAFDNGAFGFYKRCHTFNMDLYIKRLHMASSIGEPWFAVAPDIVMGGDDSLRFSNAWMTRPQSELFSRWYLAVQDNMLRCNVRAAISEYDYAGLFLGGSNEFKLRTAEMWREVCDDYSINFHYARCGTAKKIRHAKALKCDSIDSAIPIWRTKRMNDLKRYLEDAECTPNLTII